MGSFNDESLHPNHEAKAMSEDGTMTAKEAHDFVERLQSIAKGDDFMPHVEKVVDGEAAARSHGEAVFVLLEALRASGLRGQTVARAFVDLSLNNVPTKSRMVDSTELARAFRAAAKGATSEEQSLLNLRYQHTTQHSNAIYAVDETQEQRFAEGRTLAVIFDAIAEVYEPTIVVGRGR